MSEIVNRHLPIGWCWSSVATIGDPSPQIVTTGPFGTAIGREDFVSAGTPVLTIGCLRESGISLEKALYVDLEKAQKLQRYQLQAGDLLFSRMASVGRVGLVSPALAGSLFNYHIMRLRLRSMAYSFKLFIWWVRGGPEVTAYLREVNHGATRDGINTEQLLLLPVPLPPRAEQDRIVAAIEQHLSDVDAGVAALERILANLKRYRASVLKAACEGRLVPTEAELARKEGRTYESADTLLQRILKERRARWEADQLAKMKAKGQEPRDDKWKAKYEEPTGPETKGLPELPEGWQYSIIASVSHFVTDGDHNPPARVNAGIPHLTAKNVKRGALRLSGCSFVTEDGYAQTITRYNPLPGDVIVTCVGTVGETAIVPSGLKFSADRNLAAIRLVANGVYPRFMQCVLDSPAYQKAMRSASGSTAQPHLYLGDLRVLCFPLPPLAEQHRIVAEVERLLSVADETEALVRTQLARAERLRQSILKRAFEGKLVPQDPNDEPAAVLLERIRAESSPDKPAARAKKKARTTKAP